MRNANWPILWIRGQTGCCTTRPAAPQIPARRRKERVSGENTLGASAPLKPIGGATKLKVDPQTTRNVPKRTGGALDQPLPQNDFEEYFKTLISQVNSTKTKGAKSLWPSRSSQNLRSNLKAKRPLLHLQPVRSDRGLKPAQTQPSSHEKKTLNKQKSAATGIKIRTNNDVLE